MHHCALLVVSGDFKRIVSQKDRCFLGGLPTVPLLGEKSRSASADRLRTRADVGSKDIVRRARRRAISLDEIATSLMLHDP